MIFLSFLMGCKDPIYADYPVYFDGEGEEVSYGEDSSIIPGVYEEQLFKALEKGDDLHIIHGFQGGTWIHLSIRVNAMPSSGTISSKVFTDNVMVGEIAYDLRLVRTAEGFLEAYDIPIPIQEDDSELQALYGEDATLKIEFEAEEYKVSASVPVVLAEG